MSERHVERLLRELAEQEVPATLELWPAIRAQAEVAEGRRARVPARPGRRALVAACLVAFALVASLSVAVPPTLAVVRSQLQRFGLVLVEATPMAPAPTASRTAPAPAQGGGPVAGWMSLAEAQRHVPFPIRLPASVPPSLVLRRVFVGSGPTNDPAKAPISVVVSYGPDGDGASPPSPVGLAIQQTNATGLSGGYAAPVEQAQDALVHGHPAIYVSDAPGAGKLSWEENGFTYVLMTSGLGLSREDLIRIAESLR